MLLEQEQISFCCSSIKLQRIGAGELPGEFASFQSIGSAHGTDDCRRRAAVSHTHGCSKAAGSSPSAKTSAKENQKVVLGMMAKIRMWSRSRRGKLDPGKAEGARRCMTTEQLRAARPGADGAKDVEKGFGATGLHDEVKVLAGVLLHCHCLRS